MNAKKKKHTGAQLALFTGIPASQCQICKRPLTKPSSVRRGIGPECYSKYNHLIGGDSDMTETNIRDLNLDFEEYGVVVEMRDNLMYTNIPQLVCHHSPSGFAIGYAGSGPADFALNVIEFYLQRNGYKGNTMKLFQGTCFEMSWKLHQIFKFEFIAGMNQEKGGNIPCSEITTWIRGMMMDVGQTMGINATIKAVDKNTKLETISKPIDFFDDDTRNETNAIDGFTKK